MSWPCNPSVVYFSVMSALFVAVGGGVRAPIVAPGWAGTFMPSAPLFGTAAGVLSPPPFLVLHTREGVCGLLGCVRWVFVCIGPVWRHRPLCLWRFD